MAVLVREQPVVSGSAANVRLMRRVCSFPLTVWAVCVTINLIPDNVLLYMFRDDGPSDGREISR